MLEDYLWPELDELDINDMWFQQDGATIHTARVTIDLLKGKFGERVISRNGSGRMAASFMRSNTIGFIFMGP